MTSKELKAYMEHIGRLRAAEAIKKQMKPKWNKTSEVKPTEEKEHLCCSIYNNRPHFTVLG